jgi:glucose/arabinose dehydrogenase
MRWCGRAAISCVALWALTRSSVAVADTLASGDPASLMRIENFVTGLSQPTSFAFLPDGRVLITQKGGELLLAGADGSNPRVVGDFAVDTGSEKGLLSVALHPGFAQNGLLFVYYSRSGGDSLDKHRVVTVPFANDAVDVAAETVLVSGLRGPANHDGGGLAVSPDGRYLYVAVGDTGCNSNQAPEPAYTPTNFFGTCLTNGNGKILRVGVDGAIPPDNPLVGQTVTACGANCGDQPSSTAAAREDIFAWGFRNPWRIWADPETGNLWVGDVGEITYEEINVVPPAGGRHYGWPWREGRSGHPAARCAELSPGAGDCADPVYHCGRGAGGVDSGCSSITGGLIVDSCTWPASLRGRYYFADYSAGMVYSLGVNAARDGVTGARANFANSVADAGPVHLGVGPDGALYYAVYSGTIVRVAPQSPVQCGQAGAGGASGAGGTGASGAAGTGNAAGASGVAGSGAGGASGSSASGGDGCGCRAAGLGSNAAGLGALWIAALSLAASRLRRRIWS